MYDSFIWIIGIYLCLLPIIGILARAQAQERTLKDYYLAGSGITLIPLFFTLYATQYSGNTLLGFAGKAFRDGAIVLFSALGMAMIIAVYMLFAKKLQQLAQSRGYITLVDYFRDRYQSKSLVLLVNCILVIALSSYILTNFKAAGLLVESVTNGSVSMLEGIFMLAFVMAIYESLGGMRSVIWTDLLQGVLLLIGSVLVLVAVIANFGGASEFFNQLQQNPSPGWKPLDRQHWVTGLSLVVLFGLASCVYPHAIQRIYAARNWATLKWSLLLMAVMPLLTTVPIVLSAMSAALLVPDIGSGNTDQVIPRLLEYLMQEVSALHYLLALFMAAAIAAIMSTIDSAMLALGAIFTQDVFRPLYPKKSQHQLTRISKWLSWLLMLSMASLANLLPQSIWSLIIIKLEIMLQVAPALILGIRLQYVRAEALVAGMLAGLSVSIALKFGWIGLQMPLGIHAGIWGLAVNLGVYTLVYYFRDYSSKQSTGRIP